MIQLHFLPVMQYQNMYTVHNTLLQHPVALCRSDFVVYLSCLCVALIVAHKIDVVNKSQRCT
jgi:hypothetical protein